MSMFSAMIDKAMNAGVDPIQLLTGKTYGGHTQTENPLYQAVGGRHASAAAGAERRMGTIPTMLAGLGTEVAEGIGNDKGFMGHMQDKDTIQDMLANIVGQVDQARWMPNRVKAPLMNQLVPAALTVGKKDHFLPPMGQ